MITPYILSFFCQFFGQITINIHFYLLFWKWVYYYNFKKQYQMQNQQVVSGQQQVEEEQEITPEILERFKLISLQTKDIMEGFSEQSKSFSEAVGGFAKNLLPNDVDMIPAERITELTKSYQEEMRNVNLEAATLEAILKQQEEEREQLEAEMDAMFEKLERLEISLKLKKQKKEQEQEREKQKQKQQEKSQEKDQEKNNINEDEKEKPNKEQKSQSKQQTVQNN